MIPSIDYRVAGQCQSRAYFDAVDLINDQTVKTGIRTYCWIVAIFLQCFGKKIDKVQLKTGEILYLDGNSVKNWLEKNKLPEDYKPASPSIKDKIIAVIYFNLRQKEKQKAKPAVSPPFGPVKPLITSSPIKPEQPVIEPSAVVQNPSPNAEVPKPLPIIPEVLAPAIAPNPPSNPEPVVDMPPQPQPAELSSPEPVEGLLTNPSDPQGGFKISILHPLPRIEEEPQSSQPSESQSTHATLDVPKLSVTLEEDSDGELDLTSANHSPTGSEILPGPLVLDSTTPRRKTSKPELPLASPEDHTKVAKLCLIGDIDGVRGMLETMNIDLNACTIGDKQHKNLESSVLKIACAEGFLKLTQLLVENGADVNYCTQYPLENPTLCSMPPFFAAALSKNPLKSEIMKFLIAFEADVAMLDPVSNQSWLTKLLLADELDAKTIKFIVENSPKENLIELYEDIIDIWKEFASREFQSKKLLDLIKLLIFFDVKPLQNLVDSISDKDALLDEAEKEFIVEIQRLVVQYIDSVPEIAARLAEITTDGTIDQTKLVQFNHETAEIENNRAQEYGEFQTFVYKNFYADFYKNEDGPIHSIEQQKALKELLDTQEIIEVERRLRGRVAIACRLFISRAKIYEPVLEQINAALAIRAEYEEMYKDQPVEKYAVTCKAIALSSIEDDKQKTKSIQIERQKALLGRDVGRLKKFPSSAVEEIEKAHPFLQSRRFNQIISR
jgi:hypothetical protein